MANATMATRVTSGAVKPGQTFLKATLNRSSVSRPPGSGWTARRQTAAIPVGIAKIFNEAGRPNPGGATSERRIQSALNDLLGNQTGYIGHGISGAVLRAR